MVRVRSYMFLHIDRWMCRLSRRELGSQLDDGGRRGQSSDLVLNE
jgi:hypothetical protein